jgi:hypothetical protein
MHLKELHRPRKPESSFEHRGIINSNGGSSNPSFSRNNYDLANEGVWGNKETSHLFIGGMNLCPQAKLGHSRSKRLQHNLANEKPIETVKSGEERWEPLRPSARLVACAGKSQAPIAEAGTFVSDWRWLPCKTTRGSGNRLVKAEKKYGSPRINPWEDVTCRNIGRTHMGAVVCLLPRTLSFHSLLSHPVSLRKRWV